MTEEKYAAAGWNQYKARRGEVTRSRDIEWIEEAFIAGFNAGALSYRLEKPSSEEDAASDFEEREFH